MHAGPCVGSFVGVYVVCVPVLANEACFGPNVPLAVHPPPPPIFTVDASVLDFAAIPLEAQVRHARQAHLLMGVHGAALAHIAFLHPKSAVLELFPRHHGHNKRRSVGNIFANLAHWYRRRYGALFVNTADLNISELLESTADLLWDR